MSSICIWAPFANTCTSIYIANSARFPKQMLRLLQWLHPLFCPHEKKVNSGLYIAPYFMFGGCVHLKSSTNSLSLLLVAALEWRYWPGDILAGEKFLLNLQSVTDKLQCCWIVKFWGSVWQVFTSLKLVRFKILPRSAVGLSHYNNFDL
jgi:hypothetical protein